MPMTKSLTAVRRLDAAHGGASGERGTEGASSNPSLRCIKTGNPSRLSLIFLCRHGGGLPMQEREIPASRWRDFFDFFSTQHKDWITTIEIG